MEKEKNKTASWLKGHVYDVAAYAGLVITIILFLIFSGDKLMYNATTVLQTVAPYAIISLGAVFVYSMGFMDVSVGQQVGVYPSIVTSLFLMFFFTGAQLLLMEGTGNTSISIQAKIKPMDRNQYTLMLIIAIAVVAVLVTYFFKYTKFGKYTKAIGANEIAAEQSGVNTTKWKVFAYMAFGVTVAIGAFIMLTRTGSAGKGTGTGFAMDVMICLILGGMPLSGGMKSKVSSALVGTFTYVLLSNDLTTMGVDLNMINFLKAVIFIIIVMITCRKRDGVLPR